MLWNPPSAWAASPLRATTALACLLFAAAVAADGRSLDGLEPIPTVVTPEVDHAALLAEDGERLARGVGWVQPQS